MLLPNIDFIAKATGHGSVGALLIAKAPSDWEAKSAEYKILAEVRSRKIVSTARFERLALAIFNKYRPNCNENANAAIMISVGWGDSGCSLPSDIPDPLSWLFWRYLKDHLSDQHVSAKKLLEGLMKKSLELHQVDRDKNGQGVAPALRDLARQPQAGPAQGNFLLEMASLFEAGKNDIAVVELQSFCAILLATTFLFDSEADLHAALRDLFVVDGNAVSPKMAFSRWLDRLEARTGYKKDDLLWDGFVLPNFKEGLPEDRAREDLLRNPRRYRSGELVPPYFEATKCLQSLDPDFSLEEREKWNGEIEGRELGLLFVLLVANSARLIKKPGGNPDRPCQAVYDIFAPKAG
ncbi:hypothetical protein C8J30_11279 [Rhodobacter viridis]|uniref:Uncharacterized protein n=1 Tax=Rhodobacter viridis TaxID=1054202 RepID=A0A318TXL7_9RHOB|nr:hypothetical protein [Rhodobacter viridis]PYF08660.1 hypothetical protein C8J30_11279 [Rhodobacter viridis]